MEAVMEVMWAEAERAEEASQASTEEGEGFVPSAKTIVALPRDIRTSPPKPKEGLDGAPDVGHPAENRLAFARVIEVPMQWGPGMPPAPVEEEVERCSYVGPTDRKCGRRAEEKGLCKIHARWERWADWPMTCPEDRESVQEALRQTLSWLMAGHLTERQALAVVAICRAILKTL